jgi:antirestriction protein ArdC
VLFAIRDVYRASLTGSVETPEVRDGQASYIASWVEVLKSDKRCVIQAASCTQKAIDYLHGLQPQPPAAAAG